MAGSVFQQTENSKQGEYVVCGFCTEGIMLGSFVEARLTRTRVKVDSFLLPNYFQENDDLVQIMKTVKQLGPTEGMIDIIFCRLYDRFVTRGHNGCLFKFLLATVGQSAVNKFFTRRRHCRDHGFLGNAFDILFMPSIYKNKQTWDEFIERDKELTGNLEECLRRYIDWWLLGKGRAKDQDGPRRLEETGIYDPIMNTPKEEWDKFKSMFPCLFFALAVLSKTQPRSDIIKSIALTCPDGTPNFIGNDLWLQRRAFLACVKAYGIDFIIAHIHQIRPQLICHAILNIDFPPTELERLYLAVLSERDRTGDEAEYEGILQLGNLLMRST